VQQGLREDPRSVREAQAAAAHASRAAPITPRLVGRLLAVASGVCIFISLVGGFGGGLSAFALRTGTYLVMGWAGSLLGLASSRLVMRWRPALGFWLTGLATGLIMMPPMSLVVWLVLSLAMGASLGRPNLTGILWQTGVICVGMSYLAELFARRRVTIVVQAPGRAKFLDRLPLKLRGAEVWAVEAEDHYLRLHTSKGQDLILMRLSDAIDELEGVEGARVHRSWWVARDAIAEAVRGDGRATLTLKDGAEVPVSRTYARLLRERNWI